jgi:uncharacterized protein (TIGR02099 family)
MLSSILVRCLRLLWSLFAWVTILTAVVLVALRLALPLAGQYKDQIVQAVSQALDRPIRVASLEPEWRGLGPVIVFNDMQLLDETGTRTMLRFNQARVGIDVVNSLLHRRIEDSYLSVSGVDITLVRHADGTLGVEGFGAMKTGGSAGEQNRAMVQQWLQAQRRIRIRDSDIYWRDERRPEGHMHFAQVALELRNDAPGHHVVAGSVVLPRSLGHTLNVVLSFRGPLLETGQWTGRAYVDGSGLNLAQWLDQRRFGDLAVTDGVADVHAWGRLSGAGLQGLEGDVQLQGLSLAASAPPSAGETAAPRTLRVTGAAGRFDWRKVDQGWVLDADKVWLARGNEVTPQTQFRIYWQRRDQDVDAEVQVGYLRLEDMTDFVDLTDAATGVRDAVHAAGPHGELYQTYIHLQGRHGEAIHPYVYAQFVNLGIAAPWHGVPAVSGLTGVVAGTPQAGSISLNSQTVSVPRGWVFRDALNIDRVSGHLSWSRSADDWRLSSEDLAVSNGDLAARARFTVLGGHDRPRPFVDLVADFNNGNVAHAARYIPAEKMHPHAVEWLDNALVNGKVTSGSMLLYGDLADFPFDHGDGRFQVRFNVENGILDFAKDWPRIEDIQAQVVFNGRGMTLEASQGKILDSTITQTTADIADLAAKPALLTVDGEATGPTSDGLRIVTETPLRDKVGRFLAGAEVDGRSRLSLSLKIPLTKATNQVSGRLTLEDSKLDFPDKIDLTQINGVLNFTEKSLQADAVKARILGYPATLGAGTANGDRHGVYFTGTGVTDVDHLKGLKFLDLPFLDRVAGRAPWRARLRIDENPADGRTHAVLKVDSTLQGMGVDLPAPLDKTGRDKVPLTVTVDGLGEKAPPIYFRYGNRLSGALQPRDGGPGPALERAELRFGGDDAKLPPGPGLYLAGRLERFSTKAWQDYFEHTSQAAGGGAGGTLLDRVVDVDVNIGALQASDWTFNHTALHARRAAGAWRIKLVSDELAGDITLPADNHTPREFNLDYLHLRPAALRVKNSHLDPTQVPPIHMTCKQFSYDGRDLGHLTLAIAKTSHGVHVDQLNLDSPTMQGSVIGDWIKNAGGQVSSFTAVIDSKDIGDSLDKFGYVGTIKGGTGSGQLSAVWSGSPTDIDLQTLDGSVSLHLAKGRLLEVDPGAGRILGILSLQALPRRLTLDFSDLFGKGFSFDSITGDFAIRQGNAYTDNLVMEGPAAQLKTAGRVGLAAQDYDETVTVIPHLTSSLPVAVGIASGVAVGAAILLLQKIFEDQINELTRVQYTITGPWTKPVVERLPKEEKQVAGKKP